jgi:ribonuclease PH
VNKHSKASSKDKLEQALKLQKETCLKVYTLQKEAASK